MSFILQTEKPCRFCARFKSSSDLRKAGVFINSNEGHCQFDPDWSFRAPWDTCNAFAEK